MELQKNTESNMISQENTHMIVLDVNIVTIVASMEELVYSKY